MGPQKKIILVSPLDWGLGHASRCIPIIKHLLSLDCEVIIAADPSHYAFFRTEFPKISIVNLPGYQIRFGKSRGNTILTIISQIPSILRSIRREKQWLDEYLKAQRLDAVISDNRYGLWNPAVKSIFITHQLTIKTPFGSFADAILRRFNYKYICNFNACWLPDFKGKNNLAGQLSHPHRLPPVPIRYLGRLTRFDKSPEASETGQLLILLSGPEPQRSIFEKLLLNQLAEIAQPVILVRGLPAPQETLSPSAENLQVFNHLEASLLQEVIDKSTVIISRSGYSTIMDLVGRGKKCIVVPTPGQSEQEYLAKYLSGKNYCLAYKQEGFELTTALGALARASLESFSSEIANDYRSILAEFVSEI